MNIEIERNLGEQPIARIMARLTPNVQSKIHEALNESTGKEYSMEELFTY